MHSIVYICNVDNILMEQQIVGKILNFHQIKRKFILILQSSIRIVFPHCILLHGCSTFVSDPTKDYIQCIHLYTWADILIITLVKQTRSSKSFEKFAHSKCYISLISIPIRLTDPWIIVAWRELIKLDADLLVLKTMLRFRYILKTTDILIV